MNNEPVSVEVKVTSLDLSPELKTATVSFQVDGLSNTGQIVSIRVDVSAPDRKVDRIIALARSDLRARV